MATMLDSTDTEDSYHRRKFYGTELTKRWLRPPMDIFCNILETFGVVTTGEEVLLASTGWRARMLLHIFPSTWQVHNKEICNPNVNSVHADTGLEPWSGRILPNGKEHQEKKRATSSLLWICNRERTEKNESSTVGRKTSRKASHQTSLMLCFLLYTAGTVSPPCLDHQWIKWGNECEKAFLSVPVKQCHTIYYLSRCCLLH